MSFSTTRSFALLAGLHLIAILFPVIASAQAVSFLGAPAFGNGGPAYHTSAAGDFDRDGLQDVLMVANTDVLVYYGEGTGNFRTPPTVAYAASSERFPVAGDFNNDGYSDISFVYSSGKIAVVFGGAGRTFSSPQLSTLPSLPAYLNTGDIDHDGDLDLIGSGTSGANIVVGIYLNDGGGTFSEAGTVPTVRLSYASLSDYNGDSLPDLTFTHLDGLYVAVNEGKGQFGTPALIDSIDFGFSSFVTGDANNDGFIDLIAVEGGSFGSVVAVWLGNNDATFTHFGDFVFDAYDPVFAAAMQDLDGDTFPDLVFTTTNEVAILRGTGTGNFAAPIRHIDGGVGAVLGDFDRDNNTDIVSPQSVEFGFLGSGSFVFLKNIGGGEFFSALSIETGGYNQDTEIADLNGDGLKDIVVVNRETGGGPGELRILFQFAAPYGFADRTEKSQLNLGDIGIDPNAVVTGDFNNDNRRDILTVGDGAFGSNTNSLLLRRTLNNDFDFVLFELLPGDIYDVSTADFNSDGKLDIVTTGFEGVFVYFGNGNSTFSAATPYLPGIASSATSIGDFNGDQKPDIAVSNYNARKIAILLNSGTGTFTNALEIDLSGPASDLQNDDIDGDGKTDLVASVNDSVLVFRGTDVGIFGPPAIYRLLAGRVSRIRLSDLNGNQRPDIATLSGTNSLSVLENNGHGLFGNESLWGGGAVLYSLDANDLTGDGKPDLVVGFSAANTGFTKILVNATSKAPRTRSVVLDFDGDGKTDVSIFRPNPTSLLDNTAPEGSTSQWWLLNSSDLSTRGITFGQPDDKLVPSDYTGDGKADVAFFRPSTAEWFVLRSEDFTFYAFPFGSPGDIPAPGDFDGDGKTDPAVYRPSSGTWFILRSSDSNVSAVPFGIAEDRPTVADFDGDGTDDVAVYRPSMNQWWQLRSTAGVIGYQFGSAGDVPAIGDYTGDGKSDVAFFRPTTSEWFVIRSEDSSFFAFPWGAAGDIAAPGDYDGDGVTDAAVFRNADTTWYINRSTSGFQALPFGLNGDMPLPGSQAQ